jgi:hypothetical protein
MMMKSMNRIWSSARIVAGVFVAASLGGTGALASPENFAAWNAIFLQGKIAPNWGWSFESQLRLNEGWAYGTSTPNSLETRGNRLLLRPALRWLPRGDNSLQVALGYGWVPNLSPERMENRLWEQVLLQGGKIEQEWAWQTRARLEQRHIEYTTGIAHRVRAMVRAARLVPDSRLGVAIWDEVFINLNSPTKGPVSGFDQNRLFVGPMAQVAPGARVEMGYLNNFIARGSAASSAMTHILMTAVNLDF